MGVPQRTRFKVIDDFRSRNCLPARRHLNDDIARAVRLSEEKYQALLDILAEAGRGRSVRVKVYLPLTALEKIPFETVPPQEFATYVRLHSLDLRQLRDITARFRQRAKHQRSQGLDPAVADRLSRSGLQVEDSGVLNLLNVIAQEKKIFQGLAQDPTTSVDRIFRALDFGKEKLGFHNVAVYRPLKDGSGRWLLTGRTRDWNGKSKYINGHPPETTLASVIGAGDKMIFDVNILEPESFTAQGLIADKKSIEDDLRKSHGPARMLFIKLVSRFGVEAVVHLHNRVALDEKAPAMLLPHSEVLAESIKTELQIYFEEVITAIETIRARHETLPESEEKGLQDLDVLRARLAARNFHIYDYMAGRSIMSRYRGLEISSLSNPAKLDKEVQAGIVDGLNWMKIGFEDLYGHVIRVDETRVAFDKGRPVAFASADELPYVFFDKDGTKQEGRLTPMVGGWVREDYRGMKLQVRLNYGLLIRRWWQYKFSGGLFKPLRLATRTRSGVVISALYSYFRGVKYRDLDREEQAARDAFADYLKCSVEAHGIVRNAYEHARFGNGEDLRLRGRIKHRVEKARQDIGPYDGRIFIFKLTAWTLLKAQLTTWLNRFLRRRR